MLPFPSGLQFLLKGQLLSVWGFPCMLLVAFPLLLLSLSLCLVCQFDQCVSWCVSPWVYPVWDSLCLLDLIDYFLFHAGEIFNYNLFKNFLMPFLFLFFWDFFGSIIRMLVCLISSQRSLRLSSVLFILFTLFCSSEIIPPFYLPAH